MLNLKAAEGDLSKLLDRVKCKWEKFLRKSAWCYDSREGIPIRIKLQTLEVYSFKFYLCAQSSDRKVRKVANQSYIGTKSHVKILYIRTFQGNH